MSKNVEVQVRNMPVQIENHEEHRALLACTIVGLLAGTVDVATGNAVANVSDKIHKSLQAEFQNRVFAATNLNLDQQRLVRVIEHEQ
jgi:hypothetical protein